MKRLVLRFLHFNIKAVLLLLGIVLLSSGCLGLKKESKQQSIPNWYINSPANTAHTIYGVGEAKSLEEAKIAALNAMSARLVVSVGSSLQQLKKSGANGYSNEVTQDIKVDVEKIQFTNAKVDKNIIIDGTYFILMSVNRIELFNEKSKSFDVTDQGLDGSYSNGRDLATLEKIYHIKALSPSIVKNRKKSFVLYAINNSFDYAPYFKKYDGYLNEINTLKSELQISVVSNEKNKFFADEIIQMLNEDGYKVVKSSSNVEIKLHNKIRYSVARGWKIAKVSTTIGVNSVGKTVSNKTINSTGRSSSTNTNALQNAASYFAKNVKKDGLDAFLFGK